MSHTNANPAEERLESLLEEAGILSALARHFARFCHQLDPQAGEAALIGAALVAERNLASGDTCLLLDQMAGRQIPALGDRRIRRLPGLDQWLQALEEAGFVGRPGEGAPLVLEGSRLYLARHWQEEVRIATVLQALDRPWPVNDREWLARRLTELFPISDPDRAQGSLGQKRAAAMALTRGLTILTGGPGTGKTTTVTRILALLLEQDPELRIRLAAPTGKAAARLTESIALQCAALDGSVDPGLLERLGRLEAATLHRLLGWRRDGFEFDRENPLPCDCLLIDESSMVDQTLMAHTLEALPAHARLILLGDRHQLASVEAGSVLGDLTGRGAPPALSPQRAAELEELGIEIDANEIRERIPPLFDCLAELHYSYRFASGGGIGRLAGAVNQGDTAAVEQVLERRDEEIEWIEAEGSRPPVDLIALAADWYEPLFEARDAAEALEHFNRVRILTASVDGPWGEQEVHQRLEETLRRRGRIPGLPGRVYRGLPILIRRNDRETGLYNGDTGILWEDAEEDETLYAWFQTAGDGLTRYSLHQLPEWQPAWTLTVHRSQGSEYDRVALVLPPAGSRLLSRELLYTGITRARAHCLLCGEREAFLAACSREQERSSGLYERLRDDVPG